MGDERQRLRQGPVVDAGSGRQPRARSTWAVHGGPSPRLAQAAATGLDGSVPCSSAYRSRHMLRTANAW
jgi:hypothetical protein